jgi:Zn-dependent peptidase ImmA (M78 family)
LSETLARYIGHAVKPVFELIVVNQVHLKIVNEEELAMEIIERDSTEITVNSNLNKYKFLITLIHEISHLVAFENLEEI